MTQWIGVLQTYCVDSQVADSACSATAYLTGVKGNIETIGVSGNVTNRDCLSSNHPVNQAVSSMMWAQKAGKRTGVVSNMRVTHATPAGAYANVAQRDWECDADVFDDKLADPKCVTQSPDIARQLIERETGRNLNVSALDPLGFAHSFQHGFRIFSVGCHPIFHRFRSSPRSDYRLLGLRSSLTFPF